MKIKAFRSPVDAGYHFWCPGCESPHSFWTEGKQVWQFDGNLATPTVTPSILVTKPGMNGYRCHLYLTCGNLHYLDDCHHTLKGCTIPLPEWPWE